MINTYHFGFERRLNFFCFQVLPVYGPEEDMIHDITLLGHAKPLTRILLEQLKVDEILKTIQISNRHRLVFMTATGLKWAAALSISTVQPNLRLVNFTESVSILNVYNDTDSELKYWILISLLKNNQFVKHIVAVNWLHGAQNLHKQSSWHYN